MGFGDFLKNIFGKKTCAFCGGECGFMSRTKIKGKEYICGKCDDNCSQFIRKSRYTKDELAEHMQYIKRLDRIFNEVIVGNEPKMNRYPSIPQVQGFDFYDSFGMFRITDSDRDTKDRYPVELLRYDEVAAWEPYIDESEPAEAGKPKEFKECGVKLTMVSMLDEEQSLRNGVSPHPYILEPIKVCFTRSERDKEDMLYYINNVISHFNYIFGVDDDVKGLFDFGMSKKEKRDLLGAVAFVKTLGSAIDVAKKGADSLTDEKAEEIKQNLNAINDSQTDGLAEYTRRANAAEAKII